MLRRGSESALSDISKKLYQRKHPNFIESPQEKASHRYNEKEEVMVVVSKILGIGVYLEIVVHSGKKIKKRGADTMKNERNKKLYIGFDVSSKSIEIFVRKADLETGKGLQIKKLKFVKKSRIIIVS